MAEVHHHIDKIAIVLNFLPCGHHDLDPAERIDRAVADRAVRKVPPVVQKAEKGHATVQQPFPILGENGDGTAFASDGKRAVGKGNLLPAEDLFQLGGDRHLPTYVRNLLPRGIRGGKAAHHGTHRRGKSRKIGVLAKSVRVIAKTCVTGYFHDVTSFFSFYLLQGKHNGEFGKRCDLQKVGTVKKRRTCHPLGIFRPPFL